ncbi:sodium-coupled monocarboxylate transporter 2 [Halyomorpha halys]|uniref:sodium-coupled monocarboxylate transporter 2 n=1 Tax=Halyomorpha halys TaxID=286706 RepID=UPI0006D520E3|nr:sodium-coupled monocarboxylate transporter 2-like [Halyomorpha halys]
MAEFGWIDYTVFGALLVVSAGIGVGTCKDQSKSANQFLTAGGKMGCIPVALSMLASFLSSITLIGQPAEVYLYGGQQWLFGMATFFIIPIVGYIIVPFFRGKNYCSAYQYFGERFDRRLQMLASILFTFQMIVYLALVLYAPALAMNQVTGLNTMLVVSIMYGVCIFYTTIGGMRGVVWIDSFQIVVLFVAMFAVLLKGTIDIGGVSVIWERSKEFNRTNFFNFSFDMTERYTFWSSFVGSGFLHMSIYGGNQLQIQRFLTVSSVKEARKMLWLNTIGWTLVVFMCVYAGLLIFASYCYCDPLLTNRISTPDQLFPLYVMETLKIYPGFPGLFLCGIFSAGLSTVSTGVNSLAAIWFAELDGTEFKKNLSESSSGLVVKIMALGFGILSYVTVFAVPYMGGLVELGVSLTSTLTGSLLGIFLLGIRFPKANAMGATVGLVVSVVVLSWIALGESYSRSLGLKVHPPLPSSVRDCAEPVHINPVENQEEAFVLYRISYTWYCMFAVFITLILGNVVSYIYAAIKKPEEVKPNQETNASNLLLNERELKPVVWAKV